MSTLKANAVTAAGVNADLTIAGNGTGKVTISKPKITNYSEDVNAIGSAGGGTLNIDCVNGNVQSFTIDTATTTITFSNFPATGNAGNLSLIITNGGSQTVNWPAGVVWSGGSAPTLTTAGVDVISLFSVDGGTTVYGFASGLDMQ